MPKISIIIPVYNVEKYIERCLQSVIEQTFQDIEIVCINDNSTDNSLEILNKFKGKDNRITVISNNTNRGPSFNRNLGLEKSNGDYVLFTDSDNWIDKDFCEKLYNAAEKHNADIAVGGIIRLHSFHKKFHLKIEKEEYTQDLERKFELCDVPSKSYVWNKLYRRSLLEELNLKFNEGMYFEDVIFTPQVLFGAKSIVTVPDTYYYYWRQANSIVYKAKTNKKLAEDKIKAEEFSKKFLEEHNIDFLKWEIIEERYRFLGLTFLKTQTCKKKKKYILLGFIKWEKEIIS